MASSVRVFPASLLELIEGDERSPVLSCNCIDRWRGDGRLPDTELHVFTKPVEGQGLSEDPLTDLLHSGEQRGIVLELIHRVVRLLGHVGALLSRLNPTEPIEGVAFMQDERGELSSS